MKIKYAADDLAVLTRWIYSNGSVATDLRRIGIWGAMALILLLLPLEAWTGLSNDIYQRVGWIVAGGAGLVTLDLFKNLAGVWLFPNRTFRNAPALELEREITFDEEGVCLTEQHRLVQYEWEFFSHLVESDTHYILWRDLNHHLLVPRRAFESWRDDENFRTYHAQ